MKQIPTNNARRSTDSASWPERSARNRQSKYYQRLAKCMRFSERAMIRHFLSEGHDLVNKQGVRLRRHVVLSSGNYLKRFFPDTVYLEKAKGE